MFDVGWQELFLIAVVALIVVGPKDLPKLLRTTAKVLNKARAMSRDFQMGLADLARDAELDEIKRKVESAARFDPAEELKNAVDPTGRLSADFDPAEFNRKLKESVEGGPPIRPAAPSLPPAAGMAPPDGQAPDGQAPDGQAPEAPALPAADTPAEPSPPPSPAASPAGRGSG
jgi:sec-independent protein translocase protein TatB